MPEEGEKQTVEKKQRGKHKNLTLWKNYTMEGSKAILKNKKCPKCRSLLADAGNRQFCGKCGYTEFGDRAPEQPKKEESVSEEPKVEEKPLEEKKEEAPVEEKAEAPAEEAKEDTSEEKEDAKAEESSDKK